MKQIISTILFLATCLPALAQDVVKLLEPAYVDSAAVYRQSVYVPQKWDKSRVQLFIERPLGATTVRVNGFEVGGDSTIAIPRFRLLVTIREASLVLSNFVRNRATYI